MWLVAGGTGVERREKSLGLSTREAEPPEDKSKTVKKAGNGQRGNPAIGTKNGTEVRQE